MAKKKDDGTISKAEAVRQTLAAGITKPKEASAYIQQTYGLDVKPQVFSAYKSLGRKKKGKGGRRAAGRAAAGGAAGSSVELARGVKQLVSTYGADAVAGMLAVIAD